MKLFLRFGYGLVVPSILAFPTLGFGHLDCSTTPYEVTSTGRLPDNIYSNNSTQTAACIVVKNGANLDLDGHHVECRN